VVPSITTGSVISGKGEVGRMEGTVLGIEKWISSRPGLALASRMACRSEPDPALLEFETIKVPLHAMLTVTC